MAIFTIPVPDRPRSTMQIRLDDRLYQLTITYNDRMATWSMAISDDQNDVIIASIRLVLDWPLFFGTVDNRLPNGQIWVIDPASQQKQDPGRSAWQAEGEDLRMIYVEAV